MRTAAGALLLAATLTACGSTVSQRAAIERVVRASTANAHAADIRFTHVQISKLDPRYAIVGEDFTRHSGERRSNIFFLRRNDASWRVTSAQSLWPTCAAAPSRVREELFGSTACFPAAGVYTSIEWTRGHFVRLRYCQRPGGPGNFIAASKGVTCRTATAVVRAVASLPCNTRSRCVAGSFRCVEYYDGHHSGTFENNHHALCTDGRRRIEWDGG